MKQNKKKVGKNVMTAVLLILGAANIFPFIFMLSASFKPLNEISGEADTGTFYHQQL